MTNKNRSTYLSKLGVMTNSNTKTEKKYIQRIVHNSTLICSYSSSAHFRAATTDYFCHCFSYWKNYTSPAFSRLFLNLLRNRAV